VQRFPVLHWADARRGVCTPEQFVNLFKELPELPERLRGLALFLYTDGCRIGEAKKLQMVASRLVGANDSRECRIDKERQSANDFPFRRSF